MVPTLLISVLSFVLFLYWMRYNCVLILRRPFPQERTAEVAAANNLRLPEIRARLESRARISELLGIYRQLVRDHRILTALVHYTAVFQDGRYSPEQLMLEIDFRIMQIFFLACHVIAPRQARRALSEAVLVLEHFANVVGERSVAASAR